MQPFDYVVAHVWSFKDELQQVPYRIRRHGSSKADGGTGYRWSCSCPYFTNRGGKTCKHLSLLKSSVKDGTILSNSHFQITDYGKLILKIS